MGHTLQDVKEYLLRIQQGTFEPDSYIEAWYKPALCTYFISRAVEIVPKTIRFGVGLPYQCHRNSLSYAAEHSGAIAWFGFQWLHLEGEYSWEIHSVAMEPNGTLIDSGEWVPQATRYWMVPWSWELYDVIAKQEH